MEPPVEKSIVCWKRSCPTRERCRFLVFLSFEFFCEIFFLRAPSLLIVQTQWSLASGPSLRSHTRTRHAAPRAHPLPRPGGKEMRRWDSKGGAQTRMGGFSCAPRCPASLTFRDSPALVRQESDGYPVRPVASTPTPTAHSPLLVPASNPPDPDRPPDV